MTVVVPNYFLQEKPQAIHSVGGTYIKRAGSSTKSHKVRNTMHGLLVVLEGSKAVESSGSKIELSAGEAAFFMQGNYFISRNNGSYRALSIYFDESFASRFALLSQTDGPDIENVLEIDCADSRSALALAETIWAEIDIGPLNEELFKSRIETLFWELLALRPKEGRLFFKHIVNHGERRFRKVLLENLDIIESVADMSRLLCMSPAHFHRRFKDEFRISPKRWLDAKRLEKAASLLTGGEMSVAQVAAECGYSTPSAFISAFKKEYKTTPKRFRGALMMENRHF
ncbi:transcriptional regulator, AraC family [Hydrogenimonas sp.]|nr:transcriptional regulator, AraC family [Hydrogenimonas sp.]